jgi:hypothetical protein
MVGANNLQESTQASREILAYVRKLLGPTRAGSVVGGTPNMKLPIPQSGGTGQQALTNGERASGSPRQLQAEAITKPSKSSSGSSGGFNIGNDWLLSPIAGVLNSVLGIFGVGSSTSQVTRYRAQTRQPFQIVEAISPETGAGVQTRNESASGLFGVTSSSSPTAPSTAGGASGAGGANGPTSTDRARRLTGGASGAGGANGPTSTDRARRLTGSVGSSAPRAGAVGSRMGSTEGSTSQRGPQKETGMAGATVPSAARIETAAHGIATAASGEGRSLMNDRQSLVAALRRSLSDSRGFSDVLNEFQDGL